MPVPEWLREKEINARFRVNQEDWQPVMVMRKEHLNMLLMAIIL